MTHRRPLTFIEATCFVGLVVILPMAAVCAFSTMMHERKERLRDRGR